MQTEEQGLIVDYSCSPKKPDLKVEAAPGSGKTRVLSWVAEANPDKRSLYLAFNRSIAAESKEKFPYDVTTSTIHGMAYREYGRMLDEAGKLLDRVKPDDLIDKSPFFQNILKNLTNKTQADNAKTFAAILLEIIIEFQQSADSRITRLHINYKAQRLKKEKSFKSNDKLLVERAREIWKEMININVKTPASHDTYLKMWQLEKPELKQYDLIMIDEFQDSNPCVIDIINQQRHAQKIYVGDSDQAIYQFRGSINALNKISNAKELTLSRSFRFGETIAYIANVILMNKYQNLNFQKVKGNPDIIDKVLSYNEGLFGKEHAVICRTNSGALNELFKYQKEGISINSHFDYHAISKLLWSALHLKWNKIPEKEETYVSKLGTWEKFIESSNYDPEIRSIRNIIKKHGKFLVEMLDELDKFENNKDGLVTITTAHKAKGLEFISVRISDDFFFGVNTPESEYNLFFVAVTRAIEEIDLNQSSFYSMLDKDINNFK